MAKKNNVLNLLIGSLCDYLRDAFLVGRISFFIKFK